MKHFKRNGWIRIGIAATVLWIIVGAFWGYKVGNHGREQYALDNRVECFSTSSDDACDQQYWKRWHERDQQVMGYAILYSLAPIPLLWMAAYGVFGMAYWIRTGFRTV